MQCACAALYYRRPISLYSIFPHYLTQYDFRLKTVTELKKHVFTLQLQSETFLILRGIE